MKRTGILKGLQNFQVYGGRREKKVSEPRIKYTSDDFLLIEMVNMAIDFQEEAQYKRISASKVCREAALKVNEEKSPTP